MKETQFKRCTCAHMHLRPPPDLAAWQGDVTRGGATVDIADFFSGFLASLVTLGGFH